MVVGSQFLRLLSRLETVILLLQMETLVYDIKAVNSGCKKSKDYLNEKAADQYFHVELFVAQYFAIQF